ncbi:hypothetical protein, partial [Burkholderia pseudomallei]|uniref:hypothetical protein n=1 Tax=Burkholderia pseudomallei TaxID=28450 RepID=UPI001CA5C97A
MGRPASLRRFVVETAAFAAAVVRVIACARRASRAAASGRRRREQIGDAPAPPRVRRVPRGAAP